LETGSDHLTGFEAARALYERLGYQYCGVLPGYQPDPLSVFMRYDL
jgi:putative acetyltransferase